MLFRNKPCLAYSALSLEMNEECSLHYCSKRENIPVLHVCMYIQMHTHFIAFETVGEIYLINLNVGKICILLWCSQGL